MVTKYLDKTYILKGSVNFTAYKKDKLIYSKYYRSDEIAKSTDYYSLDETVKSMGTEWEKLLNQELNPIGYKITKASFLDGNKFDLEYFNYDPYYGLEHPESNEYSYNFITNSKDKVTFHIGINYEIKPYKQNVEIFY